MELLKSVKQSSVIKEQIAGEVLVVDVQPTVSKEGRPGSFVLVVIVATGKLEKVYTGSTNVKVGPATLVQTEWSAESKFGANINTKITNI